MKKLVFTAALLATFGCTKNELNLDNIPKDLGPSRNSKYELANVSFYNITLETQGNEEVEVITDSARIDLLELYNGNILSIHSFWDDNGFSQKIEGEYSYGPNGWINAVKEPGSGEFILNSTINKNLYVITDLKTGYKAEYPQNSGGNVPYYTAEIESDSVVNQNTRTCTVEIYSDSSTFSYTGNYLSQYEVYYYRSDSLTIALDSNGNHSNNVAMGSKQKTVEAWKNFMKVQNMQDKRENLKSATLKKTVFLSAAENPILNPLYQLLAPLNFDIMEVPFLHSQELPKMVTTNQSSGTLIRQYQYEVDSNSRPTKIRELIITPGNEKIPNRDIIFRYKK
ncbi:hypothetical protein [Luteibaculum oceani]|uniref:Uncharacterized protein n=1 Tax=Luteibaculum oceani TaxID=1294296 RepID=A0A5C6UZG0_9FLAO|nr:hypothetical protein [Luteibaculum oceani]TXC78657.1 hypothetical protein FRX97_08035 [Luteibaculum oceani]